VRDVKEIEVVRRRAIEVLGTSEKAHHWMETPNGAMGGSTPSELLHSVDGLQVVLAVLARIEHGVFD
jgi:putative toxin-antitoxin system antitoxin component (TIGR02293 family)